MLDVLVVVAVIVFFAGTAGFVMFCDRVVASDAEPTTNGTGEQVRR
jgi:hypothetical protein